MPRLLRARATHDLARRPSARATRWRSSCRAGLRRCTPKARRRSIPKIFELGIPTLGICYGMQLMAQDLGGRVERTGVSEFGKTEFKAEEGELFVNLPSEQIGWMSHRDSVTAPPEGARVVASSQSTPITAFEDSERRLYGVQFHPEVVHTPYGNDPEELPLHGRGCPTDLDGGGRDRGAGRAHPGAGRERASSARSPAESTPRSRRCSSTRRSATSSRASSSTTASCGRTRRRRSSRRSATTSTSRSCTSTPRSASSRSSQASPIPRTSGARSARSSSGSSRRSRGSSGTSRTSSRARSTRT